MSLGLLACRLGRLPLRRVRTGQIARGLHPGPVHNHLPLQRDFSEISKKDRSWLLARYKTFTKHLALGQITHVHGSYSFLVSKLRELQLSFDPNDEAIQESDFEQALHFLAKSGRPSDLAMAAKMLQDMPSLFQIPVTSEMHDVVLRGLVESNNHKSFQRWLLYPSHNSPSSSAPILLRHWHVYFDHCCEASDFEALRHGFAMMKCKPSAETVKHVLSAQFSDPAFELAHLTEILDAMHKHRLPFGTSISKVIFDGVKSRYGRKRGHTLASAYRARFSPLGVSESMNVENKYAELEQIARTQGIQPAVRWLKGQGADYSDSPGRALTALARSTYKLDDFQYAAQELETDPTAVHWGILIHNAVLADDLDAALSIYSDSKQHDIRPTAPLVHPLINTLCQISIKSHAHAPLLDKALEIYQDLLAQDPVVPPDPAPPPAPPDSSLSADSTSPTYFAKSSEPTSYLPSPQSITPQDPTSSHDPLPDSHSASSPPSEPPDPILFRRTSDFGRHNMGPDNAIYTVLLRTISKKVHIKKYFPVVFSLLDDIKARRGDVDMGFATVSVVTILLRSSSASHEAFGLYRRFKETAVGRNLDAKGYEAVLSAFCQCGSAMSIPSPRHYFTIVKDMRAAGHEITPVVYTILLRQLTDCIKSLPPESFNELGAVIRRVHNHLTLDAFITPDVALWNQLMDAYQRAGLFGDAVRIWETLYITGIYDDASVSIILDACGFARSWKTASEVCTKLSRVGFKFNQRVWNTWIECLCRMGRLNDAVKAACLEMGKDRDDVAPDLQTVQILLSFATKCNQEKEVRGRIQRYLPDLWKTLPDKLRGSFDT